VLFDTHCHLNFSHFDKDLQEVIKRAFKKEVKLFLNIGCDLKTAYRTLELSRQKKYFFSAIGIHPHFSAKVDGRMWQEFKSLYYQDIVAIGECGLDYYRDFTPREIQKEIFKRQIILSKELKLPLIIHCREAEDDLISILEEYSVKSGIAHCFSGSRHFLDFCLKNNFFVSFAGNVTYPKAKFLREMAKEIPLDMLLLETDCPYLAPQAVRGKRSEPQHLIYIRDELAKVKSLEPKKIEEATTANALRCFGIKI